MVILRGNDITIRWTITKFLDGSEVPEDFSRANLQVFILYIYGRIRVDSFVKGNVITVSIPGNIQSDGKVGIEAIWSKNNGNNWSRAKQVDIFEISDDPKRVTPFPGSTTYHLVDISNKLVGSVGYDGLTPEIINGQWWIGSINTGVPVTGPKGDAFTFEDFTASQIEMLKKPSIDAGLYATKQGDYAKAQGDSAKSAAEQAIDAKMALFIDMWNSAVGTYGKYNPTTKLFELNGLTDITYQQAIDIFSYGQTRLGVYEAWNYSNNTRSRTNILQYSKHKPGGNTQPVKWQFIFSGSDFEVIRLNDETQSISLSNLVTENTGIFYFNRKLRNVIGVLDISLIKTPITLIAACPLLENIKIKGYSARLIGFELQGKLSNSSILYLITNSINTEPITLTLHTDVYLRCIADSEIVEKAKEKKITLTSK